MRPRAGHPLFSRTPTHPGPRAAALRAFWCRSPPGPPSSLEPIIRLEANIDARIDKALARLVSLKEYKRVTATYSPPLITADASIPSGNQKEVENGTSTNEGVFLK